MATGGSGDVLSGVIGTFLAQGLAPPQAALLGAHVHGLAGDLAAHEIGDIGILATDIIKYLPAAIRKHMST
jgi:NAD(P)H-hydrate epimerase